MAIAYFIAMPSRNKYGIGIVKVPPWHLIPTLRKKLKMENFAISNIPCSTELEMVGIRLCLLEIYLDNEFTNFKIICDSQACITICSAIEGGEDPSKYSFSFLVYNIIKNIQQQGKLVNFEWIRGHNGAEFNELVDRLAKEGQESENVIHFKATTKLATKPPDTILVNRNSISLDRLNEQSLTILKSNIACFMRTMYLF
eukprot:NODE_550_length_6175_cov_0.398453.p4 type:complete len:199 gc:universal NODE_550_length_6175_cov_0.398453:2763-3359(+)